MTNNVAEEKQPSALSPNHYSEIRIFLPIAFVLRVLNTSFVMKQYNRHELLNVQKEST